MQLCSFLKWAFILCYIISVLDCCLELSAIPVSYKHGCASRPVCDYIPHMYLICVLESAQFSNVFTLSCYVISMI